jgi:hypothetical protein
MFLKKKTETTILVKNIILVKINKRYVNRKSILMENKF